MYFAASEFLHILSNSPKNPTEEDYFGTIPSLDLSSCIPSIEIFREKEISPYLDVNSKKDSSPCYEENYTEFIYNSLDGLFLNEYDKYLFHELSKISDPVHHKYCFSFLGLLQMTKPSCGSTALLHKYIRAFNKLDNVDEWSSFFENVSSALYTNNYQDSSLSFYLLRAVSINGKIPFQIFWETQLERSDYILGHLKAFSKNEDNLKLFKQFKVRNSILPCLETGSKDILKLLLKYGYWGVFSYEDVYKWMCKCFGVWCRGGESDIIALLKEHQFDPKRYLLILQMYFALQVVDKRQHLSTVLLLWRALNDPFLCSFEMYCILLKTTPVENHSLVARFCSKYRMVLCHGNWKPRSLKHYSRCRIRTVLDMKSCLPEGINCFNIPEKCKSYLRLEF